MNQPNESAFRHWMRVTLFVVFLLLFTATAILTLLALFFDIGNLSDQAKERLTYVTLGEIAAGIVALFFDLFGLRRDPPPPAAQDKAASPSPPAVLPTAGEVPPQAPDLPPRQAVGDPLATSGFVRPLRDLERDFLEVLISSFTLSARGKGAELNIRFPDDAPTIWSAHGKRALEAAVLDQHQDDISDLQRRLEDFLASPRGEPFRFESERIRFRYASGGTLPIVEIENQPYYCLIYREVRPIGWNIVNGGTDTYAELLQPVKAMERELSEELIIIDPAERQRITLESRKDFPEFTLMKELMGDLFPRLDLQSLEEIQPEVRLEHGPDSLTVQIGSGAPRRTENIFLNINATDLGIEIDRIVRFEVSKECIFIDGELCYGHVPGHHAVNAPIGLFAVSRLDRVLATGGGRFEPDFFFWNAKHHSGARFEEIVWDRFIPSMAMNLTQAEQEYFRTEKDQGRAFDLCPVTRSIIKRRPRGGVGLTPAHPAEEIP